VGLQGDESLKERFTLKEDQVLMYLDGDLPEEAKQQEMRHSVSGFVGWVVAWGGWRLGPPWWAHGGTAVKWLVWCCTRGACGGWTVPVAGVLACCRLAGRSGW
jgi:hypothetical protein